VKAVSDVYAPMSGQVTEVNSAAAESPEQINEDPYGAGWLIKVKLSDPSEADGLMDSAAYRKLLEEDEG
jgi:glycine cleavage system H protein